MSRALYAPGTNAPTIRRIQQALQAAGFDPHGLDGVYGACTRAAVEAFQKRCGLPGTGRVDEPTWRSLMGEPIPELFVRCLELTAAFEGHGYELASGNWDGAWLTWGIVGFTLRHGEVGAIVRAIAQTRPELCARAFGDRMDELLAVLHGTPARQRKWANDITVGSRIAEPWRTGFQVLGSFPEVQAEQQQRARADYFAPAAATAGELGLSTELGWALCFDVHVQNGGIKGATRRVIQRGREAEPGMGQAGLRKLVANAVADAARAEFREDVRRRKLALATGQGFVHGHTYLLENWGLGEYPAG